MNRARILLIGLWLFAPAAQAGAFRYDFIDIALVGTEFDQPVPIAVTGPTGCTAEGVGGIALGVSWEFREARYIGITSRAQGASGCGHDLAQSDAFLYFGAAFGLAEDIDFLFAAGIGSRAETHCEDLPGLCRVTEDGGLGLSLGLRARVLDDLELEAAHRRVFLSDFDDQRLTSLEARFHFNERHAAGFAVFGEGDGVGGAALSYRYTFSRPR